MTAADRRAAEVIALREQGLTQQAIADRLACSRSWVSTILIRSGHITAPGATRKQATQDRRARVAALHDAGRSRQAIAAELGVTEVTVYNDLRGAGGRRRRRGDTAGCGTYGGLQAHQRRGERPCGPCRAARNAYVAAWRRQTGNYPSRARRAPGTPPAAAVVRGAQAVAAARAIQRHVPAEARAELLLMLGLVPPADPACRRAS
jgi:DNA-binding CsgD family transcriptional regulator